MRLSVFAITLSSLTLASCGSRTTLRGSDAEAVDPGDGSGGFGAVSGSGGNASTGGGAPSPFTERVSVGAADLESRKGGYLGGISGDGERVAFSSYSSLDGGGVSVQIFLRHRSTLVTERVSELKGVPGNGPSDDVDISGDGKVVAFLSAATNLISGDSNGYDDVFAVDLESKGIERVSVTSDGVQTNDHSGGASLSNDGLYVAFWSYATNLAPSSVHPSVYVRDRRLGTTTRVCVSSNGDVADKSCGSPELSGNGRYVAFFSNATNLDVATSFQNHIYVHDLVTHLTERVSVAFQGEPDAASTYPAISDDGRLVAFASEATNLVPNDTNGTSDVFVYDRTNRTTVRVSVSSAGAENDGESGAASISGDGRFVGFYSCGSNLVADDTNDTCDVFVRDLQLGTTERVSVGQLDQQASDASFESVISGDGRVVAFNSFAPNLVGDDANGIGDVFVRVRW